MTSDILNSIKAILYDRIANPLIGTFLISWAVINYRLIWVLFSPAAFSEKFRFIDNELMDTWWLYIIMFIIAPALSAWFYLYILPRISHVVYKHYQTKQKELKEIKQKIEDDTPLTKEESRKIRTEIKLLESMHHEEIDALKIKIEDAEFKSSEVEGRNEELLIDLKSANKKADEINAINSDLVSEISEKDSVIKSIEDQSEVKLKKIIEDKESLNKDISRIMGVESENKKLHDEKLRMKSELLSEMKNQDERHKLELSKVIKENELLKLELNPLIIASKGNKKEQIFIIKELASREGAILLDELRSIVKTPEGMFVSDMDELKDEGFIKYFIEDGGSENIVRLTDLGWRFYKRYKDNDK